MNVGGPARHVANLSQGLDAAFPTLLVFGSVADGEAEMLAELRKARVRWVRIPELGRSVRPGSDLIALIKLIRLLRRVRPEIVHTHTAKAGTLGRIAALLTSVPVRIHTFHGHVFDGYFSSRVTRLVIGIERLLARISTRIFAISESQRDDLATRYRIAHPNKISVIPLGLQLRPFENVAKSSFREELGAANRRVITSVGRLAPIKNHDLLLHAFSRMHDREAVLALVGDGTERAHLETRAHELGVANRVRFLGWREDLSNIYAGSDVVVLTSHNEGTPVCLIEAMAAGVPVIATDVGGVRDVLGGGAYGTLIAPNDADALIRALDETPRARDGVRAIVFEKFSVDRLLRDVAEQYQATINEVVANELSDYGWGRLRRFAPRRSASVAR